MNARQVLVLLRASDAGDPRAFYAVQALQARAHAGDGHAESLLVQAQALGQGGAVRVGADVKTERKGDAMVITIAQPLGANVIVAFLMGAATIAAGIVLGILLPGMIRRQASPQKLS
jgi:hypothetical protein